MTGWIATRRRQAVELPYDRSCPIVLTKDEHLEGYTGEFLIALASAGTIDLRAIVAGTLWPEADLDAVLAGHAAYVERARRSGMRGVDLVEGSFMALRKPPSGRIEDTTPLESPGARRIVDEARRALPERPLVIVAGGHLTTAASAWLLDPSIADRLVVAAAVGTQSDMGDYNGFMDGWASYIVLNKLRYVQFPAGLGRAPVSPRRLRALPPSELRDWLLAKPSANGSGAGDYAAAISVVRADYVRRALRVSFSRWGAHPVQGIPGLKIGQYPVFEPDPEGSAIVVVEGRERVAAREFWRALGDPRAWSGTPAG